MTLKDIATCFNNKQDLLFGFKTRGKVHCSVFSLVILKGTVQQKMLILLSFTHPHDVSDE